MGRCHEFGLQIRDGCGHAMVAGKSACSCAECRVVCGGRFAGCPDVWARGPQPVNLVLNHGEQPAPPLARHTNGVAKTPVANTVEVAPPVRVAAAVAPGSGPATATVRVAAASAPVATVATVKAPPANATAATAATAATVKAPPAKATAAADEATRDEAPAAKAPAAKIAATASAPAPKAASNRAAAPPPAEPPAAQPLAAPPPVPATKPSTRSPGSQPPASAAALRWLEGAFTGLRDELQSLRGHLSQQQATMAELVSGLTQQQAMLSELLDARDADFRLAEAAESLPQFVSDAVAHEVRVNRERTVAAIASTLDAKLAEVNLSEGLRGPNAESTVAELRAFLENDPMTGSIVAAISTQAATQAMRTEVAEQLPRALNQALAGSDARMDELAERMDKLLTRAMRVGARAATDDKTARASAGRARKAAPARRPGGATVKRPATAKVATTAKAAKVARAAGPAKSTRTAKAPSKTSSSPPATKGSARTSATNAKAASTKTGRSTTAKARPSGSAEARTPKPSRTART